MESTTLPDTNNLDEDTSSKRTKKNKEFSKVWNYFQKRGMGQDDIERAECKACNHLFRCGGRYGTSTLWRHIESCKKIKFGDIGQMIVDDEGNLVSRKLDQKIVRGLLAAAVVQHDLPFSFVEYEGIRKVMKYLNPDVGCISRNTLASDITKVYVDEKEKLKQFLAGIRSRICLTSDCWTACTTEGYICLTAHFIDDNWKLHSKILNFEHMPPPHSGVELAAKVFGYLKDWGIEKKVFSLTLDNASSNDNMQEILKEQLSLHDSLLCNGEFFHIRCSAHVLNIIVQEGLKVAGTALFKIRESVKYVKGSESRMKKFDECVLAVGNIDTSVGLRLDVSTRWNSTYLMLNAAIKYKRVFGFLQLNDRNYIYCPSVLEWCRAEKLCEFLEPFYDTTNLISGSSYPTSNLYFMQVWKIQRLLQENVLSDDMLIVHMCIVMKEKFDKYWSEYSLILALGAVLDPRIKISMLSYFYSKVETDVVKCENMVALVKSKLYQLFEHYDVSKNTSSSQVASKKTCGKRIIDEIISYESRALSNAGKSQLDIYLEEPKYGFGDHENLNVLEFWKTHQHRFSSLALMAADVLAIPITTVASESAFSIGSRVLTKFRSCILPSKVQALICTRNWLHDFSCDFEDEYLLIKKTVSESSSNVVEPVDVDVDEDEDNQEEEDEQEIFNLID